MENIAKPFHFLSLVSTLMKFWHLVTSSHINTEPLIKGSWLTVNIQINICFLFELDFFLFLRY